MTEFLQVVTTTDQAELAKQIAAALVEKQLAACVQISGPMTSVYRWQGQIEIAQEWTCAIKTTKAAFDRVAATIRELHSYDEPEIIATPIVDGSESYLKWLKEQVTA